MDSVKLTKKRAAWLERTMAVTGMGEQDATALLSTERLPSFRINSLKAEDGKVVLRELIQLGWMGEAIGIGFTIDGGYEAVRDSQLARNGIIYIQNAASWLPVLELDPKPGEKILDVCAAPGGKAAHIAALANNGAELWVNDNSRSRLHKMRANLERLGVETANETLFDAAQLARKLHGEQFDKILVDAPCSGEGLMNYNKDKDFATWSVAHIKRLQQLQKKILVQAWQLLRPGGTLVYSTCTIAPEENEAVVDYLLRHNTDAQAKPIEVKLPNQVIPVLQWQGKLYMPELAGSLRLLPSPFIEAFYVCVLQKSGDSQR